MKRHVVFFLLVLLAPVVTHTVGSSIFRRFTKNSNPESEAQSSIYSKNYRSNGMYEKEKEQAISYTHVNQIETNAKIVSLQEQHLQDLHEQKKQLEQEYARQAEKLVQERSCLTDQLVQERRTRHMVEQQEQNLLQRVTLFEQELSHIKSQLIKEREAAKGSYKQEQASLLAECQELKKQLQLHEQEQTNIENTIKQDYEQKITKVNQELTSVKKRMHTLSERYQKVMDSLVIKDTDISNKDKHIAELKSQLYTNIERIANLEHHLKELGTNLDYEKTRRTEARNYIQELEKKNQDMLKAHETLQQEVVILKNDMVQASIQEELLRKKYEPLMTGQQLAQNRP